MRPQSCRCWRPHLQMAAELELLILIYWNVNKAYLALFVAIFKHTTMKIIALGYGSRTELNACIR